MRSMGLTTAVVEDGIEMKILKYEIVAKVRVLVGTNAEERVADQLVKDLGKNVVGAGLIDGRGQAHIISTSVRRVVW